LVLIDTNVLSYAVGVEHSLRAPCRRLLDGHATGRIELAATVPVIQEFAHVRGRRRPRSDAVALALAFAMTLRLIDTQLGDLELGLALYAEHERLNAFDAVLAAVALNHRLEALVSADRAFGLVPGLRWIDPAAHTLTELLSGD